MRKNFGVNGSIIMLTVLLILGCQKQIKNEPIASEKNSSINSKVEDNKSGCQLLHIDFGDGSSWHFHYNNKSLADEWTIDYGDGFPHHYTMEYNNNNNRLIKAYDHFKNTIYTNVFTYKDNLVTEQVWTNNTIDDPGDVLFTYDGKGRMIREDDIINDIHTTFRYGPVGGIYTALYFGSDLFLSDVITFKIPNRNPYLAISGIDYGFPYSTIPQWDKWWETADSITFYENGDPIVLVNYDPSQTTMQTGHQNYLTSVNYFDKVSESFLTQTFEYQNCGGNENATISQPPSEKHAAPVSMVAKLRQILSRPTKDMKKQLIELRRQLKK